MVVVRAAQLWEEGGGYASCLTSMGSSGAPRAQWEVGSPAQSQCRLGYTCLLLRCRRMRGTGRGWCQNSRRKLAQGTHLPLLRHLEVSVDPSSPGRPSEPPWACTRGPRKGTVIVHPQPRMLSSSCRQRRSSWTPSGARATSQPHCPRRHWVTLEWGKFHITAARFFRILWACPPALPWHSVP